MASVTIRGSITPSARLPRGEQITVQDTPTVRKFIADGWADLVAEHNDEQLKTALATATPPGPGIEVPADGTMSPEITGDGSGEALPPANENVAAPLVSPAKNASRDVWADWLTKHSIVYLPDTSRDQLVGLWETYQDEHPDA
jgi:hypothetical protein